MLVGTDDYVCVLDMLVGTDDCVCVGGNLSTRRNRSLGDHTTILHAM